MKKILAIILTVAMLLSVAACGGSGTGDIEKASDVKSAEKEEKKETKATIEETVLVDESGIKITAKSLEMDELFGPELKLLVENTSGENLSLYAKDVSVNGYMIENMMAVEIADGKKANDSLMLMEADLEACGIEKIADMEITFYAYTTEDYEDYFESAPISIKTSIADTYEYKFDDSGDVAYEGNDVKVVVKGLDNDDILGQSVVVYVENNRGENITVQTREVSINGFMVEDYFSCDIVSGKKAVDSITFLESDLEENGITEIENIELSFHVYDSDNWDDIVNTEVVTITF